MEAAVRGSGGTHHRPNNPTSTSDARSTAALGSGTLPRVASGSRAVAVTASPSADGSSPATVHDYRAVAAGNVDDVADAGADAGDAVAESPEEVLVGERRVRRGNWGGVFGGASRRITR